MNLLDKSIIKIDDQFYRKKYKNKTTFGYWRHTEYSDRIDDLPYPTDYIDNDWDTTIKEATLQKLSTATVYESWRGWSNCRICGIENGHRCMELNGLIFPEGLIHYIEKHNIRLPDNILNIINENTP